MWIVGKVEEGYNDIYFADDALQNVQAVKNMLDQFDVKSKVQQARVAGRRKGQFVVPLQARPHLSGSDLRDRACCHRCCCSCWNICTYCPK